MKKKPNRRGIDGSVKGVAILADCSLPQASVPEEGSQWMV